MSINSNKLIKNRAEYLCMTMKNCDALSLDKKIKKLDQNQRQILLSAINLIKNNKINSEKDFTVKNISFITEILTGENKSVQDQSESRFFKGITVQQIKDAINGLSINAIRGIQCEEEASTLEKMEKVIGKIEEKVKTKKNIKENNSFKSLEEKRIQYSTKLDKRFTKISSEIEKQVRAFYKQSKDLEKINNDKDYLSFLNDRYSTALIENDVDSIKKKFKPKNLSEISEKWSDKLETEYETKIKGIIKKHKTAIIPLKEDLKVYQKNLQNNLKKLDEDKVAIREKLFDPKIEIELLKCKKETFENKVRILSERRSALDLHFNAARFEEKKATAPTALMTESTTEFISSEEVYSFPSIPLTGLQGLTANAPPLENVQHQNPDPATDILYPSLLSLPAVPRNDFEEELRTLLDYGKENRLKEKDEKRQAEKLSS
jgi:hypothetical protein